MQPSPMAETSRLLLPNLRFCIFPPTTVNRNQPRSLPASSATRRETLRSFPLVKCPDEGIRIFVSEEIGGLVQFERGLQQVVLCHFPPRFFHPAVRSAAPASPPAATRIQRRTPFPAPRFGSLPGMSGACSARFHPGRHENSECRERRWRLGCTAQAAPRCRVSD